MGDPHIQSLRACIADLRIIQQMINQLRRGACIRNNVIEIRKCFIADMVIDTKCLSGAFKQRRRKSQPCLVPAVQTDKQIIFRSRFDLMPDLFRTLNDRVAVCHRL